ncbi:hypothetical protein [Microbaculum marinum]|uniref:Uncharacterized protein n=1 Tax=Microbaculum marinum TaxID=1764581 RepID=A0AAW9RHQ6_9HYPH
MRVAITRGMLWLGLFVLAAAGGVAANPGSAGAADGVCADDGGRFPRECTKEIRVYNNTARPIWIILQGSIQLTDAVSCTVKEKGGGDAWLQSALGVMDDCLAVKNDYYIFVNPSAGLGKGEFVSIDLPWWSKRTDNAPDRYIDWWRGARVIIFDDRTALKEIYDKFNDGPEIEFANGSPQPSCNKDMKDNSCNRLLIHQVSPGLGIAPHLPFQLNEFTFADVCKVTSQGEFLKNCKEIYGGGFIDFNQNYNVSNVDQVYLPLAMEPVRDPADVGYMGTVMTVKRFRKQLAAFTNADQGPDKLVWPVYNNPGDMYPKAGIRVPSAQSVLAFYMDPWRFPDGKNLGLIPSDPPNRVDHMLKQWEDCTRKKVTSCTETQASYYKAVNEVFLANYENYVDTCPDKKIPEFLKPVSQNPPMPKLTAYLTFIYGWVPFNVACSNGELPVAGDTPPASRSVIDYFAMQYNFEELRGRERQWFNPYTQLIHDDFKSGGLDASAYAFSIDDHASFLSNSGGKLPGGLIFAVGGPKGLMNGKRHAPPVPQGYKWYSYYIGLGKPAPNGPVWTRYGICKTEADTAFPTEVRDGFVLGIDPALEGIGPNNRCPVTLVDSEGRKYRLVVKMARVPGTKLPQTPIWPAFEPSAGALFDPDVVGCPSKAGLVDPDAWCNHANERAVPAAKPDEPGFFTIGTPPPLAG